MKKKIIALDEIPILLLLGIYPLLVMRFSLRTYTEQVPFLSSEYYFEDFFLKIKWIALMLITGIMLLLLIREKIWENWPMNKISTICLTGYLVAVMLSSGLAQHKWLAFRGVQGMLQGALSIFAYLVIAIYVCNYRRKIRNLTLGIIIFSTMISVEGMIGITQLFGVDMLSYGPLAHLLGGKESRVTHFIYGTLFHWNYVGTFVVLAMPIVIGLYFHYRRIEKKAMKRWMAVNFYLLTILICGAQSRTGICALLVMALVAGIFYAKKIEWKLILPVLVSVIMIFFCCNYYITGTFSGKWDQISFETKAAKGLKSMETSENGVEIQWKKIKGSFVIDGIGENITYRFTDAKGKAIKIRKLTFRKSFREIEFKKIYGYEIQYKKLCFFVTNQREKKGYYYLNPVGKWAPMKRAQTALPSGMEEFASLRGFVWSRTIPLLSEHILLGVGADQFVFAFPNEDYVARARYDLLNTYYNKAHNWYLQMGMESGIVSLVFMLIAIGYIIIKGKKDAFWFSILGYMVVSIFHDSFLTVAPLFWCIVGTKIGKKEN